MKYFQRFFILLLLIMLVGCGTSDTQSLAPPQTTATSAPSTQPSISNGSPSPSPIIPARIPSATPNSAMPSALPTTEVATTNPPVPPPATDQTGMTPIATSDVGGGVVSGTAIAGTAVVVFPATTGPMQTRTPLRGSRVITSQDAMQTLYLSVGETFTLQLDSRMGWEIEPVDGIVLMQIQPPDVEQGTQGVYQAHASGQTELIATGDPPCRRSKPACMMPSILFHLTVIVA